MKICDICGGDEFSEQKESQDTSRGISLNGGLWICDKCMTKIQLQPVEIIDEEEISDDLKPLIGKSAGAICFTLELPYQEPFQSIIDAASRIAYDEDRHMSTWSFMTQWLDGTTVWLSEDETIKAIVNPNGGIQIIAVC